MPAPLAASAAAPLVSAAEANLTAAAAAVPLAAALAAAASAASLATAAAAAPFATAAAGQHFLPHLANLLVIFYIGSRLNFLSEIGLNQILILTYVDSQNKLGVRKLRQMLGNLYLRAIFT